MALLHLLTSWQPEGMSVIAVSVDHRLRPEAVDECRFVAEFAARKSIQHAVLTLDPSSWTGNLSAAARDARYEALTAWAHGESISMIALGHTRTDQAETVLMNLARGSGVDGLAAMPGLLCQNAIDWVRPLLTCGRTELRDYLAAEQVPWAEDPGNLSDAYLRVRIRKFLAENDLGLREESLAMTAGHMQAAKRIVDHLLRQTITAGVSVNDIGEYRVKQTIWQLDASLRERVFAALVRRLSNDRHPRRTQALKNSLSALADDGIATIGSVILLGEASGDVLLVRDHRRCGSRDSAGLWDRRWRVGIPDRLLASCVLAPLGMDAAAALVGSVDEMYSQRGLAATPALWRDGELIAHVLDDSNADISFVYSRTVGDLVNGPGQC